MNFTITCLCNMQRILKAVNDEFYDNMPMQYAANFKGRK